MTRVLVTASFPDELIERIRSISSTLDVTQLRLSGKNWPEGRQSAAEIIYAYSRVALPPLPSAPNLRWIQTHWAGIDGLVGSEIWASDVQLTTASGIHAPNMGQYVLAQMLAWANRVPRWLHYQRLAQWPDDRWQYFVPDELSGRTLGILGYGSIGREVARLARAFGMTILVSKRDGRHTHDTGYIVPGTGDPDGSLPDRIYPAAALRSMIAACDYVVVTLPLTLATRGLIDETVLRQMKPSAFLINVGRGPIIDEAALVKALKKGWIAGAGLDVFDTEPLPSSSPLWSLDNVILSPHVSGFTPHYDDRAVELFCLNLRRYLAGEPLLNLVDRALGY